MLERVERANLFLLPLDEARGWWRYHQLFADLLRARLQQEQPGRVPALHRNAAGWCERYGLADDAVRHALARILEQRIGPWLVPDRQAPPHLYPVAGNGSGTARPAVAWAASLHAGALSCRWRAPRSAYCPAPLAARFGLDGRLAASSNGFGPRAGPGGSVPGRGTGRAPFAQLGPSPVRVQRNHPYPLTAAAADGLGAKGLTLPKMVGRGDRWQFENPS